MKEKIINIFGGGCSGFSLIRRSNEIKNTIFKFYLGENDNQKDHYWAFWRDESSKDFEDICLKWSRWKIINNKNEKIFYSNKYPYCIINKKKWINFCKNNVDRSKVTLIKKNVNEINSNYYVDDTKIEGDYFFDSRNIKSFQNILLQHFYGLTIKTPTKMFDASTVILMDFRCDQSHGLHFIYLIPFSESEALVESTLFSKNIENKKYYLNAIKSYLRDHLNIKSFKVLSEEKGVIPMDYLNVVKDNSISIGTRGGATKPSSGYTFIFIQKQIDKIIYQLNNNLKINNIIHNKFSLAMDKIFIKALELNPKIFPDIFYKMHSKLSGDEMALFMNGKPKIKTWLKIIFSSPKSLFLYSMWQCLKRN